MNENNLPPTKKKTAYERRQELTELKYAKKT